jgi:DnaJ-class molecular chaperone
LLHSARNDRANLPYKLSLNHTTRDPPVATQQANLTLETIMPNEKGPNVKKKAKCKNCEGKGLVKKGDKVVKCQRCHGTGLR